MLRLRDQAICIRHLDWSETSQVVVLLTQTHGKVRGVAKGSRRLTPSSVQKFSGGIELLTRGEIVVTSRPTSELATLIEWDLQDDHYHLRTSLPAQQLAMYAADLCNALLADHDPHPRAFEALTTLLDALRSGSDDSRAQPALLRFQWDILDDAGYRPELWCDVTNGQDLGEPSAAVCFDPQGGGLTTSVRMGAQDWRVRPATVTALRAAAERRTIDAGDAALRANRLLCAYARAILDRELPTMRFIMQ
jgi:DNA repair protein RecO (recombination protein O)